jgi:hypothetical protein
MNYAHVADLYDAAIQTDFDLPFYLEQRHLTAEVLQTDIRQLELDARFGLALIPFHTLAELTILSDQERALQRVAHHLLRGGRLVVPLHNPPVRLQRAPAVLADGNEMDFTMWLGLPVLFAFRAWKTKRMLL